MYHIIINPASRSGRGLKIWKEAVEPALHKENVVYRCYFSQKSGDVADVARELTSSGRDVTLIILGGDGTVNEALQGIRDFSSVTLGYIPTGSSNDLARDLAIPTEPLEALDAILHSGRVRSMDLGCVTCPDGARRLFAVSCGIGFDAAVCEEALHSKMKNILNKLGLGKLTYLLIALKQLIAAKPVTCEIALDGQAAVTVSKMLFVTGMIHRFEGGGFQFCPAADPCDGLLDLCAVGSLPKLFILLALPTAFWGKHLVFPGISSHRASSVHIRTSGALWLHTDGEVSRRVREFTVTSEKGALKLIC